MRNLSMKKFGTPIGAAPGMASEKVGLVVVGAPSTWRPGGAARSFFFVLRLSSAVSLSLLRLPARNFRFFAGAPVELVGLPAGPPCDLLGAGVFAPPGVGVELGFGLVTVGTVGTAGAVGAGTAGVGIGT